MLTTLISTIITLFTFIGVEAPDAVLPGLQDGQDKVVAALFEADPPNENSSSNSPVKTSQTKSVMG